MGPFLGSTLQVEKLYEVCYATLNFQNALEDLKGRFEVAREASPGSDASAFQGPLR